MLLRRLKPKKWGEEPEAYAQNRRKVFYAADVNVIMIIKQQ